MKGIMKKLLVLFMAASLAVGFVGCANNGGDSVSNINSESGENSESIKKILSYQVFASQTEGKTTRVEITITSLDGEYTLSDIMDKAQEKHDLEYESSGGMITSINGVANTADFSSCWMLYTSDTEMANSEWGTITIGDQTFGSAILGADVLEVLEDQIYVWEYVTF